MNAAVRVDRIAPGETIAAPQPGDFILVRGKSWISSAARLIQRLRCRAGGDRRYLHWSHVALISSHGGHTVEVVNAGVEVRHIEQYRDVEYHYVHVDASPLQRMAAVRFAHACIGRPYGRLRFFALIVAVLTRGRCFGRAWVLHNCAAFVALALARAGAVFPRNPLDMMPGDLARYYGAVPKARERVPRTPDVRA